MLDANKISFISCVNDSGYYKTALSHIMSMNVPEGMKFDCIPITDAVSMCAGYNAALTQSDAKYKIYLHQDAYIINDNFITDLLHIFANPTIGLIGMIGAKSLPSSLVWWESKHPFGKVIDSSAGYRRILAFGNSDNSYEKVLVVDGLMMATQYDIPWREDIFLHWHFYDIAQSIEFNKAGYDVVMPNQPVPWVEHDCGPSSTDGYGEAKKIFEKEYITPLRTLP